MNTRKIITASLLAGATLSSPMSALAEEGTWFTRPYIGISQMSDMNADFEDIDSLSGNADIDLSNGFVAGLSLGYRYTEEIAVELGWEYRSNDSETTLAGTSNFEDGNYASNLFYLNGHYFFAQQDKWQPYVGAGLTWLQEVDIDLERDGNELSYSGDGDIGFQVFAGVDYKFAEDWAVQSELRYGTVSGIDLEGEAGDNGSFTDLDYDTVTAQVGLVFNL